MGKERAHEKGFKVRGKVTYPTWFREMLPASLSSCHNLLDVLFPRWVKLFHTKNKATEAQNGAETNPSEELVTRAPGRYKAGSSSV